MTKPPDSRLPLNNNSHLLSFIEKTRAPGNLVHYEQSLSSDGKNTYSTKMVAIMLPLTSSSGSGWLLRSLTGQSP